MKKIQPKKLTLTRETLGSLTDEQMKGIVGGAQPHRPTTDSVNACCV